MGRELEKGADPLGIDAELLEILACPDCKGEVEYVEADSVIVCKECGLRYPVRDDIPVMLVEEAERPSGKRGSDENPAEKRSAAKRPKEDD